MKTILYNKTFALRRFTALALLATMGAVTAWSKDRAKPSDGVQVLSTMAFDGKSGIDLVLREAGGRSYLDVQRSGEPGIQTIDVTDPANLKTVNVDGTAGKPAENRTTVGDGPLMVSEKPEGQALGAAAQVFELWDISQAQKPRLVREFHGVQRIIEDQRGYIFVLDRDGLSVVRTKQKKGSDGTDFSIYG